jgi:hypothetical protein
MAKKRVPQTPKKQKKRDFCDFWAAKKPSKTENPIFGKSEMWVAMFLSDHRLTPNLMHISRFWGVKSAPKTPWFLRAKWGGQKTPIFGVFAIF